MAQENGKSNYPPGEADYPLLKEWLNAAIDGAPVAFLYVSADRIVQRYLGKRLDGSDEVGEVIGLSIDTLFSDQQLIISSFDRARSGEEVTTLFKAQNQIFLARFRPDKDLNGEIRGVIGFALDVTERLKLIEKLSSSESELRSAEASLIRRTSTIHLLEEIAAASNETDNVDSAIRFTIRRLLEYTGWYCGHALIQNVGNPEELVSMGIWEGENLQRLDDLRIQTSGMIFTSGTDLPGKVLRYKSLQMISDLRNDNDTIRADNAIRAGLFASFAFPVLVGDEVIAVLEFFSEQSIEPTSDFLLALGHVGNQLGRVVERQRSKEALRRSETLFRRIFEVAAFGIELVDLDGRLLAYNPAIGQIFGYSDHEIQTQALHQIDHPVNVIAGTPEFLRMVNGELETYTLERIYIHQTGHLIWARVIVSLIRGEDGSAQYVIGMIEDITEKKRIDSEVSELNRRLIEGRESERRHLAQDLHDGPIQDLYGVSYTLKSLENNSSGEVDANALMEVQGTLSNVIRSLRGIMGDLLPPTLAPFGLEKAIRSHAQQIQEAHMNLDVRLDLMPDGQRLSEEVRLALFRIYRISITNVIRHAHASQVEVVFSFNDESVNLKVVDDGIGFSLPDRWIVLARSGHLGLASAAERAQAIGGSLNVITAPGGGTQVIVKVPRSKESGAKSETGGD